jgi:sortase (surface protein transpeptidase)
MKQIVKSVIKIVIFVVCLVITSVIYFNQAPGITEPDNHVHVASSNIKDVPLVEFEIVEEIQISTSKHEDTITSTTTNIPKTSTIIFPTTTYKQTITSSKNNNIEFDYYGRLYIPDLNVNVALYYGSSQYITDRDDSANIFMNSSDNFLIIADHNNQAFANLSKAQIGTMGYIDSAYSSTGRRIIKCVNVFNGHNTGVELTDNNGIKVSSDCDYLMYTCRDCSKNIVICLWNVTEYQKIK